MKNLEIELLMSKLTLVSQDGKVYNPSIVRNELRKGRELYNLFVELTNEELTSKIRRAWIAIMNKPIAVACIGERENAVGGVAPYSNCRKCENHRTGGYSLFGIDYCCLGNSWTPITKLYMKRKE